MGDYDVEVLLAEACHFRPDEVYEMDPDFIEQLVAKLSANNRHKPKGKGSSPRGSTSTSSSGAVRRIEPDPDY